MTKKLSAYSIQRRQALGLPMSATQGEVMAATKAAHAGEPQKRKYEREVLPGVGADRGEIKASKALMRIALMYVGEMPEKTRSENVRAIVMEFLKHRSAIG